MRSFEKQLAGRLTFKPFRARKERDALGLERFTDETQDQVRAGSVIRLKNGSVQIVGDCNALFGVCDDCVEYGYEDIAEIAHIEQLLERKKPKRKK